MEVFSKSATPLTDFPKNPCAFKAKSVDPKTYSPTSLYNPIQITC